MAVLLIANSKFNIINYRIGLIENFHKAGLTVFVVGDKKGLPSYVEVIHKYSMLIPGFLSFKGVKTILSFTHKGNLFGLILARFHGVKLISTVTGLGAVFSSKKRGIIRLLILRIYNLSDLVVVQNTLIQRYISIYSNPTRLELVPSSGIDTKLWKNNYTGTGYIVKVARLLSDKGIDEFLEIVKSRPDIAFLMVYTVSTKTPTSIDEEVFLKEALSLKNLKVLKGPLSIRDVLSKAICIVSCSHTEGKPRAILEGMSMGLPVLLSRIPGHEDLINGNGFYFNLSSKDDALRTIDRFVNLNAMNLFNMSLKSIEIVEKNHSFSIIGGKYVHLIFEIND